MNAFRSGLLLICLAASSVAAQQRDTIRPMPSTASIPKDSLYPPISPRRAFFYSFLVPGYSQAVLGRHKAAATFVLVEAITISMIRESGADVREAKRYDNDSTIVSYGADGTSIKVAGPFSDKEVHSRRAHVEDWAALLVANHLFAGADAFVAAHLWDVPARLGFRLSPNGGATISASLRFK
jgi:hypothetical protein